MADSLWLYPPKGSPVEAALAKLVNETIPPHFAGENVPNFRPHMTIISDIPPNLDPQEVLDRIVVKSIPEVKFKLLNVGETYYTRVTLHLLRHPSIVDLAVQCRREFAHGGQSDEQAKKWGEETFTPHVSLVYSALDPVPESVAKAVKGDLEEANVKLASDGDPEGGLAGWVGGTIALVSTHKSIEEWKTVAEKVL